MTLEDIINLMKNDYHSLLVAGIIILLLAVYTLTINWKNEDVTSHSPDKRKALYPKVKKKYWSKKPDGMTFGKIGRRFVRIPLEKDIMHSLIIGGSGSGKTSTILNWLIWNYNFEEKDKQLHSIFALDVKPELSLKSLNQQRDDVLIVTPTKNTGGVGFDVFYGLSQEDSDDELAVRFETMSRTMIVNPGGENSFFYEAAQTILCAILMYGFRKGNSFTDIIAKTMSVPVEDHIAEIMSDSEMDNHPTIRERLSVFDGKTSDAFQDIQMTLHQQLPIFGREAIKWQFSNNPKKASPEDLIKGKSIFVELPEKELKSFSPVMRLITQCCLNYVVSLPESNNPIKNRIMFLIDEAGSIGPLPDIIDDGLNRARSKKVQIVLIAQSLSQFENTYGEAEARTILDNCRTIACLSTGDMKTAKYFAERSEQYRETKISTNQKFSNGMSGNSGQTTSYEYRPAMDVSDVFALDRNKEVLIYHRGERILVKKSPYFEIPMMIEKSKELIEINENSEEER